MAVQKAVETDDANMSSEVNIYKPKEADYKSAKTVKNEYTEMNY